MMRKQVVNSVVELDHAKQTANDVANSAHAYPRSRGKEKALARR